MQLAEIATAIYSLTGGNWVIGGGVGAPKDWKPVYSAQSTFFSTGVPSARQTDSEVIRNE